MKFFRYYWVIGLVLLLLLSFSVGAWAQTQFGTISGRVVDSAGAVIPGAAVSLTNTATNTKETTTTNNEGLYVFATVSPAPYELRVEKEGFRIAVLKTSVAVAQRVEANITMQVGIRSETVEVSAQAVMVNTVSGEVGREITSSELANMPLISRDPYALAALSAGAVDTAGTSGDNRGLGVAIAGQRTSSVNFMLDGSENNSSFDAGVAQTVPLDAVQEFRVQTSSNTAEFGRNAVVTNVVTKSGTNAFHGSAYEYYRGAALSTTPYEDSATSTPKANFVRNQFGATVGGPIIKDKTFFFGSFEGIRVRSLATSRFFVPTQDFYNASSANTRAFLDAFGGLPASNCNDVSMNAGYIRGVDGRATPLLTSAGVPIPDTTNLFCRGTYDRPVDNGGGDPQNTIMWTGRIDHHFSDRTSLLGRYAWYDQDIFAGQNSFSPYQGLNTGQTVRAHNLNLTLTHSFSPTLFNELRFSYSRYNNFQPLGQAPATTPCWQWYRYSSTPTGDFVVFPGYVPDVCSYAGIPFGGPQNVYQFGTGFTNSRGKHTLKWGAQYVYMRDNRMFGAYENAYERSNNMQQMINGLIDRVTVAIDPNGHVPGEVYSTAVDGAFRFPRFDRHFRYNEFGFYGEDSVKLTPRVTLNVGLRWEYFGVLHSPDNERYLDANLYLNAVGTSTGKSIYEQVRDARFRRTNHFYASDYGDFGPRLGLAWDVFGSGRTVFRAAYGLYYDRNFGNAVFNAIQNPPNYASITMSQTGLGPIMPNQFDTLSAIGGRSLTISSSARMLAGDMKTAYSAQWSAAMEHDLTGKGLLLTLTYMGANGNRLYSLNNLNQAGSCIRAPSISAACVNPYDSALSSLADTRLNQTGLTGMNRRGNEGLSRYNGLTTELKARSLGKTGLMITGNWTWSHSIDNEASFFADSPWEGNWGFGFRDPYNPGLDRASSTNDIRHRGTFSVNWAVPFAKDFTGVAGQVLDGWNVSSIFMAQTGTPLSVYDDYGMCGNYDATNFCFPVQTGAVTRRTQTPQAGVPNSFVLYDFTSTYTDLPTYCAGDANPAQCELSLWQLTPNRLAPRNQLQTPGMYNWDFALLKDFKLPREGMKVQFRAEAFNILNHSNMYGVVNTNVISSGMLMGKKGVPVYTGAPKERRNIQLALRFQF